MASYCLNIKEPYTLPDAHMQPAVQKLKALTPERIQYTNQNKPLDLTLN